MIKGCLNEFQNYVSGCLDIKSRNRKWNVDDNCAMLNMIR